MKNKVMTGVLLVLMIVIWGFIAFRIQGYSSRYSPEIRRVALPRSVTGFRDSARFGLSEDYRDPFLEEIKVKRQVLRAESPEKEGKVWPEVLYKGCITGKGRLAIVDWEGRICFLRPMERKGKVRVSRVEEDYVVLEQDGEKKIVKKLKLSEVSL